MDISFKQFSQFLDEAEGELSKEQLNELFGRFFGKKKEEDGDDENLSKDDKELAKSNLSDKQKAAIIKKREQLKAQKEKEQARRDELKKKADERWAAAKAAAEDRNKVKQGIGKDRDDYALHRSGVREAINKEPGFFVMSDVDKILKLNVDTAKEYLEKKIADVDGASEDNKRKARSMVSKATSLKSLAVAVSNFILAHESQKNRVLR